MLGAQVEALRWLEDSMQAEAQRGGSASSRRPSGSIPRPPLGSNDDCAYNRLLVSLKGKEKAEVVPATSTVSQSKDFVKS